MPKKPQIISCQQVAKSQLFRVESLKLLFPNGVKRIYERLAGPGQQQAVLIVPLADQNHFYMIEEYSVGTEDYQLTLPKGKVDANETLEQGANRELQEEIGFGARHFTHLKTVTLSPAYMPFSTHIFLAADLYPSKLEGDEPEPLIVKKISFSQLPSLLKQSNMTEARTISAIFLAREYLDQAKQK